MQNVFTNYMETGTIKSLTRMKYNGRAFQKIDLTDLGSGKLQQGHSEGELKGER
jgi:hypothetical protein